MKSHTILRFLNISAPNRGVAIDGEVQRHPRVRAHQGRALEAGRRDADDRGGMAVERDRAADRVGSAGRNAAATIRS